MLSQLARNEFCAPPQLYNDDLAGDDSNPFQSYCALASSASAQPPLETPCFDAEVFGAGVTFTDVSAARKLS